MMSLTNEDVQRPLEKAEAKAEVAKVEVAETTVKAPQDVTDRRVQVQEDVALDQEGHLQRWIATMLVSSVGMMVIRFVIVSRILTIFVSTVINGDTMHMNVLVQRIRM